MANERLKGKTLKVTGFLEEFEKDAVRDRVDIVSLFREFGVALSPRGKSFTGLCPFHDDRNPSLSVDREKGLYHCFGCGAGGDVFDAVEKLKGLSFKEALAWLREYAAGEKAQSKTPERPPAKKEVKALPQEKHDVPPAVMSGMDLSTVAEFYHKKLFENTHALAVLEKRGLNPHFSHYGKDTYKNRLDSLTELIKLM